MSETPNMQHRTNHALHRSAGELTYSSRILLAHTCAHAHFLSRVKVSCFYYSDSTCNGAIDFVISVCARNNQQGDLGGDLHF